MADQYSKKNVFSGVLWRFAERIGAQGVKLLVEIVLARILLPEDYGLIALVAVFITILNVFVDSGLGNALIQKKDADELDFSTVFWFNVVWCIVLYIVLYCCSPLVAGFYGKEELTPVLRILGLQIIISGVKNVEQAYVSKTMQFRKFFFATLGGTIGAAAIGIVMAYHGLGVWALVAQQLFNAFTDTVILWFTVKWRPKKAFSLERFKSLFSFGWKLLLSHLIDTVYNEIRQMIIGKKYTSSELAFYNRGRQFPNLFIININSSIDSVLFPTFSNAQDDKGKVKSMMRRSIKLSTYIISPILMGLAFCGEPFVRLVLTEKWLPCLEFLRIFCFTYMLYPIHTANLNAIKAMGRSDLFLKLELIKKSIGIVALIISMNISVLAMAYSLLITSVISQIINSWPNRKLLGYSYFDQIKDILPEMLLAIFMGACVGLLSYLHLNDAITLLLQFVAGVMLYWGGSVIFKIDSFIYLKQLLKSMLNRNKHKAV